MTNKWRGWLVSCVLVATQGCRALSPDWNGTWKLNPTKSSYQGQVMTISISADGEYRFDENSSHTLRCDGKDQAVGNNRTVTCVKNGSAALDITLKENGVKTRATHDELSTDGKVFTTTVTRFEPNRPAVTSQIVFTRLSGFNDFAGEWRDTSYFQQHADMTLKLDKQTLHINYPSAGQYVDAPLNGVEATVRGPNALEGATLAVKPAGNREFRIETMLHRKVFTQGSLKLSSDGKIITQSSWTPDRPADKSTLVYERPQ